MIDWVIITLLGLGIFLTGGILWVVGISNDDDKLRIIGIILIVCGIFLTLWGLSEVQNEKDNLCKSIGYIKYVQNDNIAYCEDSDGNLNYVDKYDCEFLMINCKIREISVGNNRMVKE